MPVASTARAYSSVCNSPYTTCAWYVEMYAAFASMSAYGWNHVGSWLRSTRPTRRENVPSVTRAASTRSEKSRLPRGEGVRVEVADSSPAVPLAITGDPLDDGVRGLVLVDAITDEWGVIKRWDGGGKTVWFECLTPPELGGSRFRTARPEPRP